ncbi:MAG: serine--tRNA ligase [Pseudomonadales bacterium]|jgi:seryl-tRNA synthetase|nr:serine--tRNA ligase [Pseudomonadales bacterium]
MLDINYIRANADEVKTACENKQLDSSLVEQLLSVDKERRAKLQVVEQIRSEVNANADTIKKSVQGGGKPDAKLVEHGKELKVQLKAEEKGLSELDESFNELNQAIPNVPAPDVPIGKDEEGNQIIRTVGEIPKFDFEPKHHAELMENLDLLDVKNAVRIGGFRSYFLKNEAVLLEQAILNLAMQTMLNEGFTMMTAPILIKKEAMAGTGYFPWGAEDHYHTQDGQILAGTSEVALTAYLGGQTLTEKDLPIKMAGISPCFRREVGTYGKDTQGIIRVHQFNKVEQVVYTVADEEVTREWHEKMTDIAEKLLQSLGIHYQVLLMCTGDMGAPHRKKYDIESWFPNQEKFRETHSASYFNDFQSRRLGIKYQAKDGETKFVYTLNNTVAATPRLLACVIENYQNADGSISVPEVLQSFVGKKVIESR